MNWVCFAVLAAGAGALTAVELWLHQWMEAADTAFITAISVWFSIRFYRAKHAKGT